MSPSDKPSETPKRGPLRRIIVWFGVILLGAPLLAAGLVYGLLETTTGRAWLVDRVTPLASSALGFEVRIGEIEGSIFRSLRITSFSLGDETGPWLEIGALSLEWSPRALLNERRLLVERIQADTLALWRLPPGDAADEAEIISLALPRPPLPIEVGDLAIQALTLGVEVIGESATLGLTASLSAPRTGAARLTLDAMRRDGPKAALSALLALDPAADRFDLELRLSEGEGGMVSALLDEPRLPGFEITLQGEGPPNDWRGHLDGGVPGYGAIEADLRLDVRGPISLSLQGRADWAGVMPADLAPFTGPSGEVDMTATWHADAERLALRIERLRGGAVELSGSARIETASGDAEAQVAWTLTDPTPVNALIDPATLGGAVGELSARYRDGALESTLTAEVSKPAFEDLAAEIAEVTAHITAAPGSEDQWLADLDTKIDLRGATTGLDPVDPLLGPEPKIGLIGTLTLPEAMLSIESATLDGRAVSLQATGEVEFDPPDAHLSGELRLEDLVPLAEQAGIVVAGALRVGFAVEGLPAEGLPDVALDLRFADLSADLPGVSELLGPSPHVITTFRADGEFFRLDDGNLVGEKVALAFDGGINNDGTVLEAGYDVTIDDLSSLSELAGLPLAGAAAITGTLAGAPNNPSTEGRARVSNLQVEDLRAETLNIGFTIGDPAGSPTGALDLEGTVSGIAMSARSDFRLEGTALSLSDLALSSGESRIEGDVNVALDQGLASGELGGRLGDLGAWSNFADVDLEGAVELAATLSAVDRRQNATLRISGEALTLAGIPIERLAVMFDGQDLANAPQGSLSAEASGIDLENIRLDRLDVDADGSLSQARLSLETEGEAFGPLELSTAAEVTHDGPSWRVTLDRLEGEVLAQAIKLRQASLFTLSPEGWTLADTGIDIGAGRLELGGQIDDKTVRLDLRAKDMPTEMAALATPDFPLAGRIDVAAQLRGTPEAPEGTFSITSDGLELRDRPADGGATVIPDLRLRIDGRLSPSDVQLSGEASGVTDKAIVFDATLPAKFSLRPITLSLPTDEAIAATARLDGRLGPLAVLLMPAGHRLDGQLSSDIRVSGSLAAPVLDGKTSLTEGRYENLITGTLFENLTAEGTSAGQVISLDRLSADAGRNGRIEASGQLTLKGGAAPALDLEIRLRRALLIRRDEATIGLDGQLDLNGTLDDLMLSGELRTTPSEFRLIGGLPSSVEELQVIEINQPEVADQAVSQSRGGALLRFDFTIVIPGQAFVRSPVLDSEWSGELTIRGNSEAPIILGALRPVRGQVLLADRRFTLEQGSISFPGDDPDPILDLTATRSTSSIDAWIRVQGRASDPELTLTSRPEYPEDEIISRVLFDKPVSQLTTSESIELAAALARVAGGVTPAAGLLTSMRNATGLDVLRVGRSEEGDPTVSAGRYVGSRVFVGVDQGSSGDSTQATVEVEVTPNISVESGVGADNSGRLGVKWKWDY
jgi:translocation and assembly module TamB